MRAAVLPVKDGAYKTCAIPLEDNKWLWSSSAYIYYHLMRLGPHELLFVQHVGHVASHNRTTACFFPQVSGKLGVDNSVAERFNKLNYLIVSDHIFCCVYV